MSRQVSIFATERAQMTDSIRRTVDLLNEYGPRFRRWRVAWSGGKDSTAVVTLLVYLIQSGQVKAPVDGLEVLYADTRMELPPLWLAAQDIRWDLEERGCPGRSRWAGWSMSGWWWRACPACCRCSRIGADRAAKRGHRARLWLLWSGKLAGLWVVAVHPILATDRPRADAGRGRRSAAKLGGSPVDWGGVQVPLPRQRRHCRLPRLRGRMSARGAGESTLPVKLFS